MQRIFSVVLIAILAPALNGCALVAANELVKRIVEERTAQEQLMDANIELSLTNELEKVDGSLLFDVNVDAWQGRVMLTGLVNRPTLREAVVQLAKKNGDVKAVYNEIEILSDKTDGQEKSLSNPERESTFFNQDIGDAWIEMKIQAQFLTTPGVRGVNYHWQSVRSRVYIIGLARSIEEKETVLRIIRETKDVKDLKSFIGIMLTE